MDGCFYEFPGTPLSDVRLHLNVHLGADGPQAQALERVKQGGYEYK